MPSSLYATKIALCKWLGCTWDELHDYPDDVTAEAQVMMEKEAQARQKREKANG